MQDEDDGRGERLGLAPDVHCASVDEDLVFLEVRRGRYSCMAGAAKDLEADGPRAFRLASRDHADELIHAGLLVRKPSAPLYPPVSLPAPKASAFLWTYPRPRLSDAPEALAGLFGVVRDYRDRSFGEILAAVRPPEIASHCTPQVQAVVDRFHRWAPFAPVSGKCFLRSFMLRRQLERTGLSAAWVFGVATWPFLAHCWLQQGDVVLDDTVDRVAKYTPILVV